MAKAKLAITLDSGLLENIDELIAEHAFANRSQAIEAAVAEKLARLARTRLAREAGKLDPRAEKAFAEEGLSAHVGIGSARASEAVVDQDQPNSHACHRANRSSGRKGIRGGTGEGRGGSKRDSRQLTAAFAKSWLVSPTPKFTL